MTRYRTGFAGIIAFTAILLSTASATTVAKLSFEELTDQADIVVSGSITRSWAAWDSEHKYIWTHYELSVLSTIKGAPGQSVEFEELGGVVDGTGMNVAGTVTYQTGEKVLIFLTRQPNGYLRTTGWGQGKYSIDASNQLHGDASLRNVDLVAVPAGGSPAAVSAVRSLNGLSLNDAAQKVVSRVRAHAQGVK